MIDKLYRIFVLTFFAWVTGYFVVYFYSGLGYISTKPETQEIKNIAREYLEEVIKLQLLYGSDEYNKHAERLDKKFFKYKDLTKIPHVPFEYYVPNPGVEKILDFKITGITIKEFYYPKGVIWEGTELGENGLTGKMAYVNYKTKLQLPLGWLIFKRENYLLFVLAPAIPHGNNTYTVNLYQLILYKPENENRWFIHRTFEFRKGTTIERPE